MIEISWTFAGYKVCVETREEAVEELKKFGYNIKPADLTYIKGVNKLCLIVY